MPLNSTLGVQRPHCELESPVKIFAWPPYPTHATDLDSFVWEGEAKGFCFVTLVCFKTRFRCAALAFLELIL